MSEQVLYRKYRPQSFTEVVGQEHVTAILQNALKAGRVAHAYLFSGPRGTGKTTVARLLAKAANCEKGKSGNPCGTCDICKEFAAGHMLDLVEIDAASSRGIDEIRELRDAVRLSPARAAYKVYIIDEVHMLTKEAFNALLKTLEEPPAHAIFILATTELQKVPETIVSRCQHFEFKKIRMAAMVERLEQIVKREHVRAEKDGLRLLAFFADGGLRDAESMLGQVMAGSGTLTAADVRLVLGAPDEERVHALVRCLAAKDTAGAVRVVNETIDEGTDPQLFAKLLARHARHMLLARINPQHLAYAANDCSESTRAFIEQENKQSAFSADDLERMLKVFLDAYWVGAKAVFPQLPLELAVVEYMRGAGGDLPAT